MKELRNRLWFLSPDEGGGEGGNGGEGNGGGRGAAVFDDDTGGGDGGSGGGEQPTPEPKTNVVDAAALAKEFGNQIAGVLGNQQQQQGQPKRDLSPEEIKKLLKVWEPSDDWLKKFGNLETQKDAILEMRDGLLQQFDTIGQMRLQETVSGLEGKFSPALEYVTKAEQRERDQRLAEKYEFLGKKEIKPLVAAITSQIEKSGQKFANEDEHFDAIAKSVEAVVKSTNPEFSLAAATTEKKQNNNSQRSGLPVTTHGAGGGGGGRTPAPAKSRGAAVFDP